MSNCDKFLKIVRFGRRCAYFVGCDIIDVNHRINWITVTVGVLGFAFFGLTAYSAYDGLILKGDATLMLQALCMLGVDLYGLSKLFTALLNKQALRKLFTYIRQIYIEYDEKHLAYKKVLNDSVRLITTVLKFVGATYVLAVLFLLCAPALLFLIYGRLTLLIQLILPGIDPSSLSGYFITLVYQLVCLFVGAFGNFSADLIFFIYVLHVPMLKNIFRIKFEDLNEVLVSTRDKKKTLAMLQDIVRWHQEYSNFTQSISDVYFAVTFIQIFTTAFSIATTIFIALFGDWPGAPAYLFYSFLVLYGYCILGSVIEEANESVCDYVYNTCLWYELHIEHRKILMIMLIKAQNPTMLTVGDIMPLSIVTGYSVTKTIYSFSMMLINVTGKQ